MNFILGHPNNEREFVRVDDQGSVLHKLLEKGGCRLVLALIHVTHKVLF